MLYQKCQKKEQRSNASLTDFPAFLFTGLVSKQTCQKYEDWKTK